MYDKNKTCCFSGHRPEKMTIPTEKLKINLELQLRKSIGDGYTTFFCGMAKGFDLLCAEAVLKEKSVNKNIALICCVPYDGFADKWDKDDRQKYDYIVSNSDELVFVCRHYSKYCFQLRNVYMVDNSSRLITAYNGCSGGTKNTVKYAKSKAIDIINLLD